MLVMVLVIALVAKVVPAVVLPELQPRKHPRATRPATDCVAAVEPPKAVADPAGPTEWKIHQNG